MQEVERLVRHAKARASLAEVVVRDHSFRDLALPGLDPLLAVLALHECLVGVRSEEHAEAAHQQNESDPDGEREALQVGATGNTDWRARLAPHADDGPQEARDGYQEKYDRKRRAEPWGVVVQDIVNK